ncbi:DUF3857 domain-containing protein [Flavobacterium cellulosilyticum]|uniref:DUF3857 domain-containing protein n=1 Tax=Flavobacterium cellulosilyticum TaxID=2541731 RepID=A0A4R5CAH3_9FLAO|nr:DUF3857 domain-containing protein [Flavobacterium cellulosilyticum]TDD96931.1 DUF3857 domain-containing protein [Flavobacterium cellulosilyticum]
MKINYIKSIITLVTILSTSLLFSQDYSFKNYDWNEKETKVEVPEKYKNEKEVILSRISKIEIVVKGKTAKQYHLLHEKIFINSDDAIERNNKIYIPFNLNESVLVNKARVILKNGTVINLDQKDIKEDVDQERGMKYNYFAVNGLEKGAVIEKMYVLEESPEFTGQTIKMQDEYPIANLNFELIYPNYLIFKTKSYNGLSEPVIDEKNIENTKVLSITEKDIPALDNNENYSNWAVQLKQFRYKLDENQLSGGRNLNGFKEFASNIYEKLNPVFDKKQQKSIDDFCATIPKSEDLQAQIWNIENKIKKTITYNKYIDTKASITDIIDSKQANQSDILKIYLAVFKEFKIENNMVFTSNRYKIPFDKDFESYENLNELLFYFPSINKYLTPTEIEYRIPLFPVTIANNYGLFVKEKTFTGVKMGIGEVNFIEIPGNDISHDIMNITVDFTKDFENPLITSNLTFGGYSGLNFQPFKDFVSAEQYKTFLKNVAENYTVEADFKSLTTENDGTDFIGKKPFILNVTYDGKDLTKKAGENYLFSIGETIGKQMEFYQENKRTLPVEIDYPHYYTRNIKILLPKGATIKNLDKFVMDYKTQINGKTEAAFISKYTKKGDEIMVENKEFYNIINYPLNKFDEYKAVINAAADFNKIVIIVTK